jgi:hypothetical protein
MISWACAHTVSCIGIVMQPCSVRDPTFSMLTLHASYENRIAALIYSTRFKESIVMLADLKDRIPAFSLSF